VEAFSVIGNEPKPDELTTLKVSRGDTGVLVVEAFAGATRAAARSFQYVSGGLLGTKLVDATQCEPGQPLLIEVYSGSGAAPRKQARLALAADGSLVVQVDTAVNWFERASRNRLAYARFRAMEAEDQLPPPPN
jgi:hypothetical protein